MVVRADMTKDNLKVTYGDDHVAMADVETAWTSVQEYVTKWDERPTQTIMKFPFPKFPGECPTKAIYTLASHKYN